MKYFTILILMSILVAVSTVGIAEAIQLQVLVDTGSVYSAYRASDIYDGNSTQGDYYNEAERKAEEERIDKIREGLAQLNGTTASQFIKSGLGLTSRIVQIGFSNDQIWYGDAGNTEITSLQPYIAVDSSTSHAAVVPAQITNSIIPYNIPNLRDDYTRAGNVLNSASVDSPFDYTSIKSLIGTVTITSDDTNLNAVTATGDGIAVITLADNMGNVKVSGNGIATHVLSNSGYNLDLTSATYTTKGYIVVNGVTTEVAIDDNLLTMNKSWLEPDTFSYATPTDTTIIKHGFAIGGNIPVANQTINHIITPIPIGNAGETWGTAAITEYSELTHGQHATAPLTSVINKNNDFHEHGEYRHSHPTDTTYKKSGGFEVALAEDCDTTNTCYAHGVAGNYEAVPTLTESGLLNEVTAVSLAGAELWSRAATIESEPSIIDITKSLIPPSTNIRGMTYANDIFYALDDEGSVHSLSDEGVGVEGETVFDMGGLCDGLTFHNNRVWCAYETGGQIWQRSYNVDPLGRATPTPIATNDNQVTGLASHDGELLVSVQNGKVFAFNIALNSVAEKFTLNPAPANPVGMTHHNDKFWIVNDVADNAVVDKVYAYNNDGTRSSADDFDLLPDNNSPSGIEVVNNVFYIFNDNNQIYIYDEGNVGSEDLVLSTVTYNLYNTLPVATLVSTQALGYSGPHEATDTSFLYVRPVDSTTPLDLTLSGAGSVSLTGLSISDLPPERLYQIVVGVNDYVIDTGITNTDGKITIGYIAPLYTSGKLLLYPDNILVYDSTFDTAVFDTVNNQVFKLNTNDKKIYTIHAYVKIPISSGPITIGNMTLVSSNNAPLTLGYLDGEYQTSDEIHIPVVPGYKEIRMDVDGTESSLKYANVLGNSGVTIISSATSTIETSEATTAIPNAEAIASSTGYIIATSDGEMQAVISETISGSIALTNTYTLNVIEVDEELEEGNEPERRDPLTAYVDVYINGVKEGETVQIGINPFPDFEAIVTTSDNIVSWGVTYTYPDYTLSSTLSTNVNAGDFIEFHVYAKIFGEIEQYGAPPGRTIEQISGESTATANIRSAYIYADYITE